MNEKFYALPEEKRLRIINAGYHIFGYNSYKKSPVSEIAVEASISKSLLFHYFRNKKQLYLFLWSEAIKLTIDSLKEYDCYEPTDLFEMMRRGMYAKLNIMRIYPDLAAFTIRAFYEKDKEVAGEIQESYALMAKRSADPAFAKIDPENFRPGLDLDIIHKEIRWASEGYVWEAIQSGTMDIDKLEKDFTELLDFWQTAYCVEKK